MDIEISLLWQATWRPFPGLPSVDGLAQDCSISIANALEILQSYTKLSISPVAPSSLFKLLQLVWRPGSRRWNLRTPCLQTGFSDLTYGYKEHDSPGNGHQSDMYIKCIVYSKIMKIFAF